MTVKEYLENIKNEERKSDCQTLFDMMKKISQSEPKIWHRNIIGFGSYHYKYESGTEGYWLITGFSSRSQNISIYILAGFDRYQELLSKLGTYKTGKSCLYIKRLSDIDMDILELMIKDSFQYISKKYN